MKSIRELKRIIIFLFFTLGLFVSISIITACKNPTNAGNSTYTEKYTIQYTSTQGGYIDGEKIQSVEKGGTGSEVVAVPDEGYIFVKWSDNQSANPSRIETNVVADLNSTAIFEKIKLNVSYFAADGGKIDGVAGQEVAFGENAEFVVAVPKTGYIFVKWSDGKSSPIRREYGVTSSVSVTAEFEFLYGGGDGTAFNPFTITNYTQLNNIWYYPDSNFKLINDLDLSGIAHEPIFDDIYYFKGRFDGGGYTIKNVTIKTESNFPSLFGFVYNGTIGNLNVENVDITTFNFNTRVNNFNYCVGIVAGVANGFMHDLNVSGKISGNCFDYDDVAVGGLVGMGYGTFENCNANVFIEISDAQIELTTDFPFVFSGLIGVSDSAYIRNCAAEGSITVTNSSNDVLIGGLVGYYFTSQATETYIEFSETRVSILTDSGNVGGFIGNIDGIQNSSLLIKNSAVHGDIKARTAAGFIYTASSISTIIENCYTDNDVIGAGRATGFIYKADGIALTNCKAKGNISLQNSDGGSAGYVAGFCYQVASSTMQYCCATGNVTAENAFGFAFLATDCNFEQCYSTGKVNSVFRGAGFIYALSRGNIINCYSISNVYNINEDENTARTDFAGFAVALRQVNIENSYYGGEIFGTVYASYPKASTFVCTVDNTNILNCHTLHNENGYALNVIGQTKNEQEEVVSLMVYTEKSDMFFLADLLNKDLVVPVWVNCPDTFPQLIK